MTVVHLLPFAGKFRPFVHGMGHARSRENIIVGLIAVFLTLRVLTYFNGFPTGNDPGNWIAVGNGLFGADGKSSSVSYPPLIPALVHISAAIINPVRGTQLIGALSLTFVFMMTFLTARPSAGFWLALTASLLVSLSRPLLETVAFGGYPQNYALGLAVAGVFTSDRYLVSGKAKYQLVTALVLVLASLCHHVYFVITILAIASISLLWMLEYRFAKTTVRHLMGLFACISVGASTFIPVFVNMRSSGYEATLDANTTDFGSSLEYAFGDAWWLYLVMLVFGSVYLLTNVGRRGPSGARGATGLVFISGVAFLVTDEPRLLPLLVVGSSIGFVLGLKDASVSARMSTATTLAAGMALGGMVVVSTSVSPAVFDYYRVADRDLVETANWLDHESSDGIVVVGSSRDGWPVGWWFEGLTHRETFVGSSAKWLAFPSERAHAMIAGELLDGSLTGDQAFELARANRVESLVIERASRPFWQSWLSEPNPRVTVAFENDRFIVLRFRVSASATH